MAMTTETVWAALDSLLDYAKNCGLLHPLDETFARNTRLSELRLELREQFLSQNLFLVTADEIIIRTFSITTCVCMKHSGL